MLRFSLNQATLELDLSPRSGFLIKAGEKGQNLLAPQRSDMGPLRTRVTRGAGETARAEETVFIPGSSLKGVLRSAGERALRSLSEDWACDPHDHRSACQRGPRDPKASSAERHAEQCLACRVFGSQQAAGRLLIADALPSSERAWTNANQTSLRSGVSIDRRTGGPAGGKLFESEIVSAGSFRARMTLENFQLWQLALLGMLMEDIDAGELHIGSGRTRGLGAFNLRFRRLELWQIGAQPAPAGVGVLRPDLAEPYDWMGDRTLDDLPPGTPHRAGLRWIWEDDPQIRGVLGAASAQAWPPGPRGAARP